MFSENENWSANIFMAKNVSKIIQNLTSLLTKCDKCFK